MIPSAPPSMNEWRLLNQVMDEIDTQRACSRNPIDKQWLERTVLETYQSQGIRVDRAMVRQAILTCLHAPDPVSRLPSPDPAPPDPWKNPKSLGVGQGPCPAGRPTQ